MNETANLGHHYVDKRPFDPAVLRAAAHGAPAPGDPSSPIEEPPRVRRDVPGWLRSAVMRGLELSPVNHALAARRGVR